MIRWPILVLGKDEAILVKGYTSLVKILVRSTLILWKLASSKIVYLSAIYIFL